MLLIRPVTLAPLKEPVNWVTPLAIILVADGVEVTPFHVVAGDKYSWPA